MTFSGSASNRVRRRRVQFGLTQTELAERAGISRTAVTAIEGERLSPSVDAALAIAEALGTSVEELFGREALQPAPRVWSSAPSPQIRLCWQAEVRGRTVFYPAGNTPTLSLLPESYQNSAEIKPSPTATETLVMACCDPAAGFLASQFAAATGLRLVVMSRSSQKSLEMLREGLVHLAGMHLSTADEPERNQQMARGGLQESFHMIRLARWQEGIATSPSANFRSVKSLLRAKLKWVGRDVGSGARQCLDRLRGIGTNLPQIARDHQGVIEALRSGWADAGVCVQLASAEAGLNFHPIQEEAFDICFPAELADDRRIKAFVEVIRSAAYRQLLGGLPGYDVRETGNLWEVDV